MAEKNIGPSDAANWPTHFWAVRALPRRAKKQDPKVMKHFSMQAFSHFRDERRSLKSRILRVVSVVKNMEHHGVLCVYTYAPLVALYISARDFAGSEAMKQRMQKLDVKPVQKLLKVEAEAFFSIGRVDLASEVHQHAQELNLGGRSFQHFFDRCANRQPGWQLDDDDKGDLEDLGTYDSLSGIMSPQLEVRPKNMDMDAHVGRKPVAHAPAGIAAYPHLGASSPFDLKMLGNGVQSSNGAFLNEGVSLPLGKHKFTPSGDNQRSCEPAMRSDMDNAGWQCGPAAGCHAPFLPDKISDLTQFGWMGRYCDLLAPRCAKQTFVDQPHEEEVPMPGFLGRSAPQQPPRSLEYCNGVPTPRPPTPPQSSLGYQNDLSHLVRFSV
jgi:hypothetical protein